MKSLKFVFTAALLTALSVPANQALAETAPGDETPPPAEAPYPNAPEEGFAKKLPAPVAAPGDEMAPNAVTGTATDAVSDALTTDPVDSDVSNEPLLSPADTKRKPVVVDPSLPKPIKKNQDGSYDYGKAKDRGGEYRYKPVIAKKFNYNEHDKPPQSDHSASVRFAYFGAPSITNPDNGLLFRDVYHAQHLPAVLFDYEWKITHKIGDVGIKLGSGVFYAQGNGHWADPNRARTDGQQPLEKFSFFMLPNTLSGIYRFKYADKQVLVPYGEGGGGFFTFVETRDDSGGPKFGGAATAFIAGGLNILVDGLDRDAMSNLRRDNGINHLYLNVEYREIFGLNTKYNFASSVLCGGLGADF